jgi:hypothetical protein
MAVLRLLKTTYTLCLVIGLVLAQIVVAWQAPELPKILPLFPLSKA